MYDGHQADWETVSLPVPQLDGAADARVRFRLTTDTNTVDDGWHVDDIALTAVFAPPAALFSDGFEGGNPSLWSLVVP